jgi:hypothetical protein
MSRCQRLGWSGEVRLVQDFAILREDAPVIMSRQ